MNYGAMWKNDTHTTIAQYVDVGMSVRTMANVFFNARHYFKEWMKRTSKHIEYGATFQNVESKAINKFSAEPQRNRSSSINKIQDILLNTSNVWRHWYIYEYWHNHEFWCRNAVIDASKRCDVLCVMYVGISMHKTTHIISHIVGWWIIAFDIYKYINETYEASNMSRSFVARQPVGFLLW